MFERIMVCLDGSKLAEQVLPYSITEAMSFGSRLILFQSVPEPVRVSPKIPGVVPPPLMTETLLKEALIVDADARIYLEEIAKILRKRNLRVDTITMPGITEQSITSYAEENNIDLIAISTHGRGGLGRAVFGSVADYVLRESRTPVLVVKPRETEKPLFVEFQPFKKILVCLDGSEFTEQILPYAVGQASHFNSKIILLKAYETSNTVIAAAGQSGSETVELMETEEQKKRREVMSYLEEIAQPMRETGLEIICVALQGTPEDVIVSYAQNEVVDLIMLATHGRSSLARTIFGSVADHVLRESGLPVLLIKSQEVSS